MKRASPSPASHSLGTSPRFAGRGDVPLARRITPFALATVSLLRGAREEEPQTPFQIHIFGLWSPIRHAARRVESAREGVSAQ